VHSKSEALSSKCKFVAALLWFTAAICGAEEAANWRVFLEPRFMKPAVSFSVPKAEQTVFAPGMIEADEVKLLSKSEWAALGVSWEKFRAKAAPAAEAALGAMRTEFTRDSKNVIEFAMLAADQPLAGNAVLAPGFVKKFEAVFGPRLLVVVPNRFVAFVFPALAGNHRDFSPMVLEAYRATPFPVSLELFEISAAGIRAIGVFEQP
jgi:hypothetical protein